MLKKINSNSIALGQNGKILKATFSYVTLVWGFEFDKFLPWGPTDFKRLATEYYQIITVIGLV